MALAGAAGCAAADAMTPQAAGTKGTTVQTATNEVGLNPGESMAFEVRIAGVLAGAAALFKRIVDEATTVIDLDSGRPLQLETLVEQGKNKTTASARFNGAVA